MTNIYLEKLAKEQEKRPGFWSTTANHAGVGTLIGGAGGAVAGAAAGHALKDFAGKALEEGGHDAKGILKAVPIRRVAATVGAHTGAGALGLAGAGVGVLHGAYRATRNHMDKKASDNQYLEKIASTALSRHVDRNRLDGSGMDGHSFMSSSELNKAYTGMARPKTDPLLEFLLG